MAISAGAFRATRQLILPPNLLSLARVPLAVLFALEVAASRKGRALATLAVAASTDVADGWLARRLRQETAIGQMIDPAADKLFFGTAMVSLARSGRLVPVAALLLGTREITQLTLALFLAARGELLDASATSHSSTAGKMTTVLQAATAAASLGWVQARDLLVTATAVCGLVAGAMYWSASLVRRKSDRRRRGHRW
jgi:CDP-diacylglycerol--glycerol-3-phosphate 3-phosphatidyltransferase/cardiolipin synthase